MAFSQNQIQGILGEFKPVIDVSVTPTNNNIQGVFGEFKPAIDNYTSSGTQTSSDRQIEAYSSNANTSERQVEVNSSDVSFSESNIESTGKDTSSGESNIEAYANDNVSSEANIEANANSTSSGESNIEAEGTGGTSGERQIESTGEAGDSYTRENKATLPTNSDQLDRRYTSTERTTVSTSDDNRVKQEGSSNYLIHEFRKYNSSEALDQISIEIELRVSNSPASSTVYLQIYNFNTTSWETLDSDSTSNANTDFSLTGSKTTNLSNYYDTDYTVLARVYQQL